MRYVPRAILAGGLGFAVSLLIAACGGGVGLLSADQSSTLSSQLDQVSSALQNGDCGAVSSAATGLGQDAGSLPGVSATLRNNLIQGASTVAELARRDCRPTTSSSAATSTQAPSTQATTPPTTSSTQSSTAATSTTSSTSTRTTPATTPSTSGTTTTGGTTGGAGIGGGGNGKSAGGNGQGSGNGSNGGNGGNG